MEKLRRGRCTLDELVSAVEVSQASHASKRTVQRDLERIRHEYGVGIAYSKTLNGYYLEEQEGQADKVARFLEQAGVVSSLRQMLPTEAANGQAGAWRFVQFDQGDAHSSTGLFPELLTAIKGHRVLRIRYNPGFDGEKDYEVRPLLLKEYQHRWYLACRKMKGSAFRSLALDRIIYVQDAGRSFRPNAMDDPSMFYRHVIGISHDPDNGQPRLVRIASTPKEAHYLRSSPWHPSQEEEGIDPKTGEHLFTLYVELNYELVQVILRHRDQVRVIGPDALREEVADTLRAAVSRYA